MNERQLFASWNEKSAQARKGTQANWRRITMTTTKRQLLARVHWQGRVYLADRHRFSEIPQLRKLKHFVEQGFPAHRLHIDRSEFGRYPSFLAMVERYFEQINDEAAVRLCKDLILEEINLAESLYSLGVIEKDPTFATTGEWAVQQEILIQHEAIFQRISLGLHSDTFFIREALHPAISDSLSVNPIHQSLATPSISMELPSNDCIVNGQSSSNSLPEYGENISSDLSVNMMHYPINFGNTDYVDIAERLSMLLRTRHDVRHRSQQLQRLGGLDFYAVEPPLFDFFHLQKQNQPLVFALRDCRTIESKDRFSRYFEDRAKTKMANDSISTSIDLKVIKKKKILT